MALKSNRKQLAVKIRAQRKRVLKKQSSTIGRIIAGKPVKYKKRLYPGQIILKMRETPHLPVGSHGTLEFIIEPAEKHRNIAADDKLFEGREALAKRLRSMKGEIMTLSREVPPAHRRRGIGTALLKRAERLARRRGVELIYAVTSNPYAVRSYEKAGWQRIWSKGELGEYRACYGKFLK